MRAAARKHDARSGTDATLGGYASSSDNQLALDSCLGVPKDSAREQPGLFSFVIPSCGAQRCRGIWGGSSQRSASCDALHVGDRNQSGEPGFLW